MKKLIATAALCASLTACADNSQISQQAPSGSNWDFLVDGGFWAPLAIATGIVLLAGSVEP
jgi:hypothetical protein